MLQIMSKIKDDLHIVLQLLCFVGHPVQDSNTVNKSVEINFQKQI